MRNIVNPSPSLKDTIIFHNSADLPQKTVGFNKLVQIFLAQEIHYQFIFNITNDFQRIKLGRFANY